MDENKRPMGYSGLPSSEYDRFPKAGDRMVFTGEGGYEIQRKHALETFKVGQVLTVEQCGVSGWDHRIWFAGHEGWFNGVLFDPVPKGQAPWTDEQVAKLNEFQSCDHAHPFTCPGEGGCPSRNLIATNEGWVCACGDYTQDWAHEGMFLGAPPNPAEFFFGDSAKVRDGNPGKGE